MNFWWSNNPPRTDKSQEHKRSDANHTKYLGKVAVGGGKTTYGTHKSIVRLFFAYEKDLVAQRLPSPDGWLFRL